MKMPTLPKMKMPKLPKLPKPQPKRLQATARRAAQPAVDDYDEEPTTRLSSAFVVVLILHIVAVGGIYAFNSIKAHRRGSEMVSTPVPPLAAKSETPVNSNPSAAAPVEQTAPANGATSAPVAAAVTPRQTPATPVAPVSGNRIYHVRSGDTLWRIASIYDVSIEDLATVNGLKLDSTLRPGQALNIPAGKAESKSATVDARGTEKPSVSKTESVAKAATPSKVSTSVKPTASPSKSSKTYTVKKGDNPVTIAKKLGVSYEELLKVNKISDPRRLRIGHVLKLPAKD